MHILPMMFHEHEIQVIIDPLGNPWWPAAKPCELLGLRNVTVTLGRLEQDEKKQIALDTPGGRQKVWCVNEYGLYNLILGSRKPEAKAFKRWVTHELLPEVARTGRYTGQGFTPERLQANTQRRVQAYNAREVADLQSRFGGRNWCIRYNITKMKEITGHTPKEWRVIGKAHDLPGRVCQRGQEVLRMLRPAQACASSLADELVVINGINQDEAISIGKDSTALFQRIIDAGVIPAELHSSPLDGIAE